MFLITLKNYSRNHSLLLSKKFNAESFCYSLLLTTSYRNLFLVNRYSLTSLKFQLFWTLNYFIHYFNTDQSGVTAFTSKNIYLERFYKYLISFFRAIHTSLNHHVNPLNLLFVSKPTTHVFELLSIFFKFISFKFIFFKFKLPFGLVKKKKKRSIKKKIKKKMF